MFSEFAVRNDEKTHENRSLPIGVGGRSTAMKRGILNNSAISQARSKGTLMKHSSKSELTASTLSLPTYQLGSSRLRKSLSSKKPYVGQRGLSDMRRLDEPCVSRSLSRCKDSRLFLESRSDSISDMAVPPKNLDTAVSGAQGEEEDAFKTELLAVNSTKVRGFSRREGDRSTGSHELNMEACIYF